MGATRFVLKRPVTAVLAILCLVVFGLQAFFGSKQELMPDMEMPYMLISTVYPGASPEDIDDLVTKEIENSIGSLSGIKAIQSYSMENASIVMMQYEYGTNMDKAYDDLKKKMDSVESSLPDDCKEPEIMELNMNDQASMYLSVNNPSQANLYNYVNNTISPELEKISTVASINISGGQKQYIRIQLIPEKLEQYHLTMSSLADIIGRASFTYPAGETIVGGQKLSVSAGADYDTVSLLKQVPISLGNGNVIYLEDVADVYTTLDDENGIARYKNETAEESTDTISVAISKQQSATATEVSKSVNNAIKMLQQQDPNLEIVTVYDASDDIQSSLSGVYETMVMAVLISMLIIYIFFGEIKASLIVGTSIPISILAALIAMNVMGFSLNVITMSSLVLGVGMMVDNSIVVLESCFRAIENKPKKGLLGYREAAFEGTEIVFQSIIGGTATTCVVFLPLAFLSGLTGQFFKPLGYTVVFCLLASLLSAITVVPLCYCFYKPEEKEKAPAGAAVRAMQRGYRKMAESLLRKKALVMIVSVLLLGVSLWMATQLRMELMTSDDTGTITITVDTRPGLTVEEVSKVLYQVEDIIKVDQDLESYMVTYGGGGLSLSSNATVTAYLKDDRVRETDDVLRAWRPQLSQLSNANITLEAGSNMSMTSGSDSQVEYILQSTQYEELKTASDRIANDLMARSEVTKVHSTLENGAPVVKLEIDAVKANAENITPIQIATAVADILGGKEATTLEVDGKEVSVMLEYPKEQYDTIDELQGIVLKTNTGGSVALTDVADIVFRDSPTTILRMDKQYQVTITGELYTEDKREVQKVEDTLYGEVVTKHMGPTISRARNTMDTMMVEEFTALAWAIAIAVFLVFVVMAAQFESPKFSIMVMLTIPFSLIGAFGLLYVVDSPISMVSLLGFLMLVGTVVNNGILYVDTVNQYRQEMDMNTALIEAGATRLRPILMTTLTTVVSMVPMCFAFGDSGQTMQGLALVFVGGLTASTVLSLLMLPVFYALMSRKPKKELEVLD